MKSSVITNERSKEHFVENYRFKILGQEKRSEDTHSAHESESGRATEHNERALSGGQEGSNLGEAKEQGGHFKPESSFIEELLKRTDEMSGSMIKLQMQIENQENEFAKRLESEIQRAKEDGIKQGRDEAAAKFESLIASSEAQLPATAVEVAKEVVKKEISLNSANIAAAICKELFSEIKDAKEVQIKVNPKDYEFIKENFSGQNVKISADEAISAGGAIVLSDAGNLEGTIEARLEKIKKIIGQ
jgi:flagellar assembly protein fliH